MPNPYYPTVEDLPALSQEDFTEDDLDEKIIFGLFINKTYDGTGTKKHFGNLVKDWKQQIDTRKDRWVEQMFANHFSTYCEKRRSYFQAHLQRLLDNFNSEAKPKEEAAKAAEAIVAQMRESMRHIELPLINAINSMK
jgi:hypothetical protein